MASSALIEVSFIELLRMKPDVTLCSFAANSNFDGDFVLKNDFFICRDTLLLNY